MSEAGTAEGRRYGGRTREERAAERRRRFLDAALELFAERGYGGTTIEALCAQAGLAARYFYEEFGSREALLRALYDEVIGGVQAAIDAALDGAPLEPRTLVRTGLEAFVEAMTGDERRARIAYSEVQGASPALERHRLEVVREEAVRQAQRFEALAAAGAIPARPYGTISLALAGAANQVLQDWLAREDREPVGILVDDLVEIYLAVLAPRG